MKTKVLALCCGLTLLVAGVVYAQTGKIGRPPGGGGNYVCVGNGDGFCVEGNYGSKCFIDGLDNNNCCSGTEIVP